MYDTNNLMGKPNGTAVNVYQDLKQNKDICSTLQDNLTKLKKNLCKGDNCKLQHNMHTQFLPLVIWVSYFTRNFLTFKMFERRKLNLSVNQFFLPFCTFSHSKNTSSFPVQHPLYLSIRHIFSAFAPGASEIKIQ